MIEAISFIISFFASIVGAIVGIGGGVVIKPLLDATRTMNVGTISFLSGVTVLSMTSVSLIQSRKSEFKLDIRISSLLAGGGAIGGIFGKILFDWIRTSLNSDYALGAIQSGILLILLVAVVLYILFQKSIKTYAVRNVLICVLTGMILGLVSAFLGIGGGPFNVVALYWIFSMDVKTAAKNSLFIIGLSQLFSLVTTFTINSVPSFSPQILALMITGGILGGIIGTAILKRICIRHAQTVFMLVLIFIIGVNMFNLYNFLNWV